MSKRAQVSQKWCIIPGVRTRTSSLHLQTDKFIQFLDSCLLVFFPVHQCSSLSKSLRPVMGIDSGRLRRPYLL